MSGEREWGSTTEVKIGNQELTKLAYETLRLSRLKDFGLVEDEESLRQTLDFNRKFSIELRRGQNVEIGMLDDQLAEVGFIGRKTTLAYGVEKIGRMLDVIYGPEPDLNGIYTRDAARFMEAKIAVGRPRMAQDLLEELNDGTLVYFRPKRDARKKPTHGIPVGRVDGWRLETHLTQEEIDYIDFRSSRDLKAWVDNYEAEQRRGWDQIKDIRMTR